MCSWRDGEVEPVGEQEEDGQTRRQKICWAVMMTRKILWSSQFVCMEDKSGVR